MKRIVALLLCAAFAFLLLAGCNAQPKETVPTEPTQSPEEAAVFKVLMIGQSHAQDSVWLLYEVLKAEMPDKEFLVVDVYQPLTLGEHVLNIKNDASVYDYCEIKDGNVNKVEGYRLPVAVKQEQWDLIIFNEATWPQTDEFEHTDGDMAYLKNYLKENAAPGFKLAYNATWAQPISAAFYTDESRATPPDGFYNKYNTKFGGDRRKHFARICELIERYEEQDPDLDYVFHSGTAIQYASETHGVPEADPERKYDLYRDYTHLSDFGRLIVAYQIYAQIFGLTELTEVNVDVIPAHMRATFRERPLGDIEITQTHKEAIMASVNYALKNPNKAPEQIARQEPILEPLH